jgi:putative ABC transport system permease protein
MSVGLESFRTAWATLRANRLRTALTVLTMALGALTMTFLVSLATSALATILTGVDAVGGRELVFVSPRSNTEKVKQAPRMLTMDDANALRMRVPNLKSVDYLMALRSQALLGEGRKVDADVGIGAAYQRFLMQERAFGRFIEDDEDGRHMVLTTPIAKELFGDASRAVGKHVLLWNSKYEIVGVTRESSALGFGMGGISRGRAVFVSTRAAFRMDGIDSNGFIVLRDDGSVTNHDLQIQRATSLLTLRHHADDAECFDMRALLRTFDVVFIGIRVLVGLIALVCTILAGTGTMNVMLASVKQRVSEIGVRRAMGASQKDIRRLFLIESALMSAVGGVLGALLGLGLTVGAGAVATSAFPAWQSTPSWTAFGAAILAAIVSGLAFGLRPARRASALPVVACLS